MRNLFMVISLCILGSGCSIEQDPTYYQHQKEDQSDEAPKDWFDDDSGGYGCALYHENDIMSPFCAIFFMDKGRPPDSIQKSNQQTIVDPAPKQINKEQIDNFPG